MWLARMKVLHTNCLVAPKCIARKVKDYVWLVNAYENSRFFYYSEIHVIEGESKAKRKFISDLKAEKTIVEVREVGNLVLTLNREPLAKRYYAPFFDRSLFQNKPIVVDTDGYEYWEFASWDKGKLLGIIKKAPPVFEIELTALVRIRQGDVFLPRIFPEVTDKQRQALLLAIQAGYYGYPRKADLERLAKAAGLSRQTYQEHLRRAEAKVMAWLFESL